MLNLTFDNLLTPLRVTYVSFVKIKLTFLKVIFRILWIFIHQYHLTPQEYFEAQTVTVYKQKREKQKKKKRFPVSCHL